MRHRRLLPAVAVLALAAPLIGFPGAWSPGTNGIVTGDVPRWRAAAS